MVIHHLNCGSFSPRFPHLNGIVYCLLVETSDGLLLVDTGFGKADYTHPSRMMRLFTFLLNAQKNEMETAASQVVRLGYSLQDVRHIVLTHLHLDHAGGLRDFPRASVHVYRREYEVAMRPRGLVERGYDVAHWAHGPNWVLHDQLDREWFGFKCCRILEEVKPEIWLVPLPGHTSGHCGVVIATDEGWLFHCGDAASPFHREVDPHNNPPNAQALNFLPRWLVHKIIGHHVPSLRHLLFEHSEQIQLISSHDVFSYNRLGNSAA